MAGKQWTYRYMRTRADGKANETYTQKNFEKWLREFEEGDRFFVAKLRWVECAQDGEVSFGDSALPHVAKVADVDGIDNGPKVK